MSNKLRFKVNGNPTHVRLRMYDPSEYSWVNKSLNTEYAIEVADAARAKVTISANTGFELVSASGGGLEAINGNVNVSNTSLYNGELRVIEVVSKAEGAPDTVNFIVNGDPLDSTLSIWKGVNKIADLDYGVEHSYEKPSSGHYLLMVEPLGGATVELVKSDLQRYDNTIHDYFWRWKERPNSNIWSVSLNDDLYYTEGVLSTSVVTSTPATPDVYSPFNRIWHLDRDSMNELSEVMYMINPEGDNGVKYNDSKFVLNLLALPFELPSEVIGDMVDVKIGKALTGVTSPLLLTDVVRVDLGEIEVLGLTGSSIDYVNTQFELMLPFIETSLKLEPSEVIGKTIRVEYVVDVYRGDLTVNVFNGELEPFMSKTDRIGRDIPIHLFKDVVGSVGDFITADNGIYSASIRVATGELSEGMFSNLVTVDAEIGEYAGYVEVVNADLKGIPRSDEVLNILKGGVVIR